MTDIFELAKSGDVTPSELGYYFPAEFAPHASTWLSWPHKEDSWPGKIHTIYPAYSEFIKIVAQGEKVNINVADEAMKAFATKQLVDAGVNLSQINFHLFPTNDAWCRDHGPAFLINPNADEKKALVKWNYNAWGNKYPPHDLDNQIPYRIAEHLNIPCFNAGIVMEGGSVEFNGKGTLLTSRACLLNENRNPHLIQSQIEKYLCDFYGVHNILWVEDGIVGDDTDGHIDDITRFVNEDTVVTVVEENKLDENHFLLEENLQLLKQMRLEDGKQLNIVELPMPEAKYYEDQRLPASYANFYIANEAVVVPTFRDKNDQKALDILSDCFKDRKVVGVDSLDIIWGLGSFHCLSQQEPAV
ncbi:agmatine deiminase family protein [Algoriphagus machipongonensis]|uniref:Peptidyl-arginine deiminase n=1 Tax=Algoriphagus machipongonensis TaxID=388413 RepID=A3HZY5_9BACT|nr:agmatine deiminase family protein [Algoriphagus machipongonensis]EAZ80821.1 peptidyl-arginine deiminase [Algoriphagus machipongonensis]